MPVAQGVSRHEECGVHLPDGWVRSAEPADRAEMHAVQTRGVRQNKER
ncbi:hypothetical protein DFR70_115165 [Nocardia tenerifensis]|uniref:Uncharacterized protein n=1 Tax=Nocardia tenerifensis TaxID=228006 RepID=A0A318JW68_9NOCA|nr:hypothetical protein DFR70_115165 [Nocardia tenerifensis]